MEHPPPNQYVLLAELNHLPVGFICLLLNENNEFGSLVDNLHVANNAKGQGIGTQLMKYSAAYIEQHFTEPKFYLWVFQKNYNTRRFYKKLGGACIKETEHIMPDGNEHMLCRYVWNSVECLMQKR
jgi:GNAT superfamily N-acetyltransferase